ncbi:MAG: glutamate--tRNA ligase [Syntrophaceae bacterium]|jgi:glutamyl-tRNA synthetase|nr:glutamate--tRNA ligase [Syntrophaceae bacterium]HOC59539.1 glutamate--tRNA ligase [Smithellaceae bacterium]HQM45187.1 glutamate--tRNA ligase [Smithellaceae bacterium]
MICKMRTRFAPSPTGYLHIGGARTALFNWLFSRHHGGEFVLRIEDTDQQRSTDESTKAILDAMTWLGLDWDEGPHFQARRVDLHREMVQRLLHEGKAYVCTCTPEELENKRKDALASGKKPKYDGACREKGLKKIPGSVVRFRGKDSGITIVEDLIKGNIAFNNEELDDLIIERGDGYPTYNFAVVIDDAMMNITHVIRGDDHVNNTPRQILMYKALGFDVPKFAHVPMILGSDKARLSKRHGATSVMAYKKMGYLPEALVNYLVRLGWSHGDQEIFSIKELIEYFDLSAVGKSPAVFNPDKLNWLNSHYIKESPPEQLTDQMKSLWPEGVDLNDSAFIRKVVTDLQPRVKTLTELADSAHFYFTDSVLYEEAALKFFTPEILPHLKSLAASIVDIQNFTKENLETFLKTFIVKEGIKFKVIAQPLRVALTGKTVSPGIDEVMMTLGRNRTRKRLNDAIAYIENASQEI